MKPNQIIQNAKKFPRLDEVIDEYVANDVAYLISGYYPEFDNERQYNDFIANMIISLS